MIERFNTPTSRWSLTVGAIACFLIGYLLVSWGGMANNPNYAQKIADLIKVGLGLIVCAIGSILWLVALAVWSKTFWDKYR